jgi:hypothetical protein
MSGVLCEPGFSVLPDVSAALEVGVAVDCM